MGKNKSTATTETPGELAKRLKKIDKALRDPDLKKKARKALQAERDEVVTAIEALSSAHVDEEADKPKKKGKKKSLAAVADELTKKALDGEIDTSDPAAVAKAINEATGEEVLTSAVIETLADTEAERATHRAAVKLLRKHGHPGQPSPDDIDRDNPELVSAYNLVVGTLTGHLITSDAERERAAASSDEAVADIKARVAAKREARKANPDELVVEIEGETFAEPVEVSAEPKKKGKKAKWEDPEPYYIEEANARYSVEQYKAWDDDSTSANLAVLKPRTREEYEADLHEQDDEPKVVATLDQEDGPTLVIADPEALQPRDRWDRPIIEPVGGGKGKGYKRTTTFIDVIDDKSALTSWGRRVVLAGVGAIEQKAAGSEIVADISEVTATSVVDRIIEANERLAASAKTADKALKKGKLSADGHAEAHDNAEKIHKRTLDLLAEEAFKAGDGFVKAETGTRIHRLTEIYDTEGPSGLKALGDVTPSEYRDIEAYAAACAKLNVEILAVEQFVVVDELEVGGTLDRRLRYDSPKLGRRITAIGDVKTGRVDYGMGKMTRQLAIYAKGKGYDWQKPEERVTYRTNQEVGLIFHIPAGSGVCEVWEIDLKKGWEGVQLCAKVFAHRSETTQAKVGIKVATSVEAAS